MRKNVIPYGKQDISQQDIDSVIDVLNSDFLTQGPQVPAFEQALIDYSGASYALAVNSATSALHIACLALGLGEEDLLWTSPITFVAVYLFLAEIALMIENFVFCSLFVY